MSGTNLATAYVQIIPTTKGIQGGIEEALGGAGGGSGPGATVGKNFTSGFIKAIKYSAIGVAVGKTFKDAITGGAQLEQSLGGVETLYKDSAETIKNYARDAWYTAGVSANDYMEQSTSFAAALLNSTKGNTKRAAEAANMAIMDMSDNANKFGTDIQSIQNAYQGFAKQNYTMLDNLKLGYGGTKKEAERLLEDASKISGKKYELGNLEDLYNAIHVIQEELGVTGTTAEEASKTLSGSFGAMKASFTDYLANLALGDEGLGANFARLTKSVGTFAKNLIPAIGNVFKSIPESIANVDFSWGDLGSKIIKQLGIWYINAVDWFRSLNLGDFFGSLPGMLASVNWNGILIFFKNQVGALIDNVLDWIGNLGDGIEEIMPSFFGGLPKFIGNVADIINENAPKILIAGGKLALNLIRGFIQSIPTIVKSIPQIVKTIFKVWTAISWASLGRMVVTRIAGAIRGGAGSILGSIRASFGSVKTAITSPFVNAFNTVRGIIARVRGWFPISIGRVFTGLKVPKFSLSKIKASLKKFGSFEIPEFRTIWNAKGGIVDGATLIGAGEKGAEGIVPLDPFWERMDNTLSAMRASSAGGSGTLTVVFNVDGTPLYEGAVDYINGQTLQFGVSPLKL